MSDDEEMPPMGEQEFEDEPSDDEDMGSPSPDGGLPEGVKKEIITEAPPDNWKKPRQGDEVTVHYVGTLLSDGSEFDSSRSRNKPFVFTLGRGQVIKGWDLGVASMKKGEVAKFTLAPEFAYGDSGSPPKIPEKATLVFEVELISWASKDDLFSDEGVIKTQLEEGKGWKSPGDGDEILLSLKSEAADGSVIEDKPSFEYTVGSTVLGQITKAVEKGLSQMKKGEKASLKCTKDYAYGDKHPDGATITLTLEEIYEVKDVSFNKDKSMMKKRVREGEGYDTAKEGAPVKLLVTAATDGSANLPGFKQQTLEFKSGDGDVCDALECAAVDMKKGERAILTVTQATAAADAKLGLKDVKAAKVVFTLEMVEFEKIKESWSMSEEEKIEYGTARKEVGTALLKAGRMALALQRYKKVADVFSYIDNFKEDTKEKAQALQLACNLNQAAVLLKLKDFTEARVVCNKVLKDDARHVKALYRKAQAELGLKNFSDCIRDCKKVVEIDPQNRDARALIKEAQAGQKEEDKQAKGLFANMCKALGKGPIPEPGKAADIGKFDEDEDSEMDDDEGKDAGEKDATMQAEN